MLRMIESLGDRLLERLVPKTSASAAPCPNGMFSKLCNIPGHCIYKCCFTANNCTGCNFTC